jgi:integrase
LYGNSRVWLPALKAAGLPAIHFHDLRHAGNTLAASAGASLRELMERMGQDSDRAALEASLLKIIRRSQEPGLTCKGS